MIRDAREKLDAQDEKKEDGDLLCTYIQDPFATLPPELRPAKQLKNSLLRKATCPGCGLVYRTNRATDLCVDCEKKAIDAHAHQVYKHD
jgi:hypothetical protein